MQEEAKKKWKTCLLCCLENVLAVLSGVRAADEHERSLAELREVHGGLLAPPEPVPGPALESMVRFAYSRNAAKVAGRF